MMKFITVVLGLVSLGHVVSAVAQAVTGTFVPTVPGQCHIQMKAFGMTDTGESMTKTSYIKVNGLTYFEDSDTIGGYRGFNLITLDVNTCRASNFETFDTHETYPEADRLANYINGIPDGTHILGVTDDEAQRRLNDVAKAALTLIGVDASGLDHRGKLIFHAIKAKPGKAIVRRNLVNEANLFYEEDATATCGVCQNGGLLVFNSGLVCQCPATHTGFYCEDLAAVTA